jgi:hypothetical protein
MTVLPTAILRRQIPAAVPVGLESVSCRRSSMRVWLSGGSSPRTFVQLFMRRPKRLSFMVHFVITYIHCK